ncbi:MAG: ribose 5-phosphate isomerase B [Kiritimatiellae bacterium]|jgi:ribose 5-phosphate isomerase B|nr:ribose 5-phosphate isomerase B [Kiritimatiellia bacterium]
MKIVIANDHGGYKLKLEVVEYLKKNNYEVEDLGSDSEEIVRYPYYAETVAKLVQSSDDVRGILICSTGIGMSIIANKFKGIRASMCTSTYMGRMTRAHNNSNILCLGGKITGEFEALDILEVWLDTEYEGGRHDISLDIIKDIEIQNFQ